MWCTLERSSFTSDIGRDFVNQQEKEETQEDGQYDKEAATTKQASVQNPSKEALLEITKQVTTAT